MTLAELGWTEYFEEAFAPFAKLGLVPGRLSEETKINFTAILADGTQVSVILSGRIWHEAENDAELPAVGDWVALDIPEDANADVVIRGIVPRRSTFSRRAPGKSAAEHVIATNIDYVVVVTDPGEDFNMRRLERFYTLIRKGGATPVILINKSDLHDTATLSECEEKVDGLGDNLHVHTISALHEEGIGVLRNYLNGNKTLALCGSSGVGKSTLVNSLLGEDYLWTNDVNDLTGKGRHTTVARELIVLEEGGILIDNPGVREVQMWTDETTLRESFTDIQELVADCKFHDCKHRTDKGCAIRGAYEAKLFDLDRYQSFLNLEKEIEELKAKQKKRRVATERWAKRNRKVKARNREDRFDLENELDNY